MIRCSYLGGVESDLFRTIAVKVDAVKAGSSGNSGNDEGYIRTTSILDIECGEELELNRDIACIYLVIALADWITTQEDEEKRSLDKSLAS